MDLSLSQDEIAPQTRDGYAPKPSMRGAAE
jgi:hypothetical protein